MSLFIEATRHNFTAGSEDRLTQVIVAAFNSNLKFRKTFFYFLKIKFESSVRAFSQVHEHKSRPDIKLIGGRQWTRHIALIESKTEMKSGLRQLRNHRKTPAAHHILILKYRESVHEKRGWKVSYWSDLALLVGQELGRIHDHSSFDFILFHSLIEFFREYGFMKNSVITKRHLENAGSFLNTVRFETRPRGSLTGITDLQKITETMELALEILKVDSEFARNLTEISAIRPATTMAFTYRFEDVEKLTANKQRAHKASRELAPNQRKFFSAEATALAEYRRHRANTLSLEKRISLKGEKKNGIKSLSLSLEQVDSGKNHFVVQLSIVDSAGRITSCREWNRNSLPKGGLTAQTIAKAAAKEWSKWLKKKSIQW